MPDLTITSFVQRGFTGVFIGGATLAAAYLALNPPDVSAVPGRPAAAAAHRFEWLVPVLLVDLVFAVFVAAQAAVLFGGHDYVQRTTGLTYAEYVHQGFGQLTVATLLMFLVVWAASRRAGTDPGDVLWLRISLGLLCALTLVVVVSALHRMQLYQEAYGFTQARLVVDVFEGWLGIVVLAVALSGLVRWGTWVPRFALVTGVVGLLGIAAVNPDDLDRPPQHRAVRGDRQDRRGLPRDPLRRRRTRPGDQLPEPLRAQALDDRTPADDDWLAWNLGRWRAAEHLVVRLTGSPARRHRLPRLRDMSGPNTSYDPVEVTPLRADQVEEMRDQAFAAIAGAGDLAELKQVRIDHAGDRSPLALANREIGALPPQARKEAGQRVGQARGAVTQALAARQAELEVEHEERMLVEETVDVTLPTARRPAGSRHPLTMLAEDIADVFLALGWEVAEGPVVEAEWLNFDALNLGPDHPARTMQDTFWTEPADNHVVLRTHTSPVQARTMLTRKPPIYVVCPGRVYRTDEYDATHSPVFHQVEGLVVDEGITMAHLKGTLDHFAASMFGDGITTRFRPSYFPFTEPSAEVDLVCFVCRGVDSDACRTCRGEGWIEWGGCGVVNPRVLTACGVDAERYTGFAFGMGIDRTLMFRHGVEDLRDLFEGDVRFSSAFGTEL